MRVTGLVIGLALAVTWLPGQVLAQTASTPNLSQPVSVATATYDEGSYPGGVSQQAAQESSPAAPLPPVPSAFQTVAPVHLVAAPPAPAPVAPQDSSEGQAPAESQAPADPEPAKPWTIPQPHALQELGIKVGGWVQQGATANGWNPPDGWNGPNATNDRTGYEMNQAWLYFVRPTNTEAHDFDIGGRINVMYGSDYRFGVTQGLENRYDDLNNFYGLILPQFYAEIAYQDLTVKVGHYASLTSMELVPAPVNFFYSHTVLISGYCDPLLLTGFQADYKLTQNLTLIGGMHDGWLNFEDPEDKVAFLGGVKWSSTDKKSTLSVMIDNGPEHDIGGEFFQTTCWIVGTHQFNDEFWWGGQLTVGHEAQGSFTNPGQNANWWGFEHEFTYKLNPKWSVGLRYELVHDPDASRVAGLGNILESDKGWGGPPGSAAGAPRRTRLCGRLERYHHRRQLAVPSELRLAAGTPLRLVQRNNERCGQTPL